jgi:type IV secretion system protein VirB6
MFATLFAFIDTIVGQNIASMVGVFATTITPLMGACVILYVIYLSYQSLYEPHNMAVMESIKTILSLSIVTFIAFNTAWYLSNIVPAVLTSGDNIAQSLLGTPNTGGGAALQAMFDITMQNIILMFEQIDFDLLAPSSWADGFLIFFQIFIVILGFIPFMVVATAYLLVAKIMVSFLLIIGPLFIMMAFFPSTRSFFQAWTGQCFNYALLSLMYPIAFSIYNQVLDNTIFSGNINFASVLMTPVVFGALILLSVQIPILCSTLSGGVGISGLVGGLSNFASAAKSGARGAASAGKGAYKGARAAAQFARNLGKGKVKPG